MSRQIIDLEGVRALLCRQLEQELHASVTGSVSSSLQTDDLLEVTFDLWIEKAGTRINRQLFVVLRPDLWDIKAWREIVRGFVDSVIRKDFMRQHSRDLKAKAAMN
jgi:hypothetical protein